MPTIQKTTQTRESLIDKLAQIGLEDFVHRHAKEILQVEHTSDECALPGYADHMDCSGYVRYCGIKDRELAQMIEMEGANPLIVYSSLEDAINGMYAHVRMAILPSRYSGTRNGLVLGSAGDVIFHVQPYGPRAEELKYHLKKRLSNGNRAFFWGRCVGFLSAAVGLNSDGNSVLYIDTIQTDGNKRIRLDDGSYEHSLPGGLRKMYMDGKKRGTNAWYDEGLNAIETASGRVGIPIAIPTWEEVVTYAEVPSIVNSDSAKRIYEAPKTRGYRLSRVYLKFPQKPEESFGPTLKERHVNVWLKPC